MRSINFLVPFIFAMFLAMSSSSQAAESATFTVLPDQSPVSFLAVGKPGFLRIKGEGAKLQGSATLVDGTLSGAFTVALEDLKTGMDLRDHHMKQKYLETAKFPLAKLTLKATQLPATPGEEFTFKCLVEIKGKVMETEGKARLESAPTSSEVKGQGTFNIVLTQFDVGVPYHLGITVAEQVEITVKWTATRKTAAAH